MSDESIEKLAECCDGECSLAQIARMSRSELIEALVETSERAEQAEAYIDELVA